MGVRTTDLCLEILYVWKVNKEMGAEERVLGRRTNLCEESMVCKDPRGAA